MKDYKIIVIGYGIVGKLEYNVLFDRYVPDVLDLDFAIIDGEFKVQKIAKSINELKNTNYDLAIVAVPTPYDENTGVLDCHLVEEAVNEVNADIYMIKSTTNLGYCDYLQLQTGKHIIHSPEHAGATQHCNNFEYNFTILGGDVEDCQKVQEIYQEIFDARHVFRYVTRKEAEAAKLTENAYLANNVSFWTSIWEGLTKQGICFENVRECVTMDPRISRAHSSVYPSHPYWDSHCFNKDMPAYANQIDNQYLKDSYKHNQEMKKKYKK